jgi:hypothetical protein
MMHRATFIVGAAVGYVLGTRAGKERYEQIKRASNRFAENLQLQETAGVLRAQAGDKVGTARDKVSGTLHEKFGEKADKIPGMQREAGEHPSPAAPTRP